MLSQHYSYEIDDYGHLGAEPLEQQWRRARAAVIARAEEGEQVRAA